MEITGPLRRGAMNSCVRRIVVFLFLLCPGTVPSPATAKLTALRRAVTPPGVARSPLLGAAGSRGFEGGAKPHRSDIQRASNRATNRQRTGNERASNRVSVVDHRGQ